MRAADLSFVLSTVRPAISHARTSDQVLKSSTGIAQVLLLCRTLEHAGSDFSSPLSLLLHRYCSRISEEHTVYMVDGCISARDRSPHTVDLSAILSAFDVSGPLGPGIVCWRLGAWDRVYRKSDQDRSIRPPCTGRRSGGAGTHSST